MATERDRKTAAELIADVHSGWCAASHGQSVSHPCHCRLKGKADAIAAALAAERERARAPFARVTEDLDLLAARYTRAATGSYDDGIRCASANSANMLRAAALDAEL